MVAERPDRLEREGALARSTADGQRGSIELPCDRARPAIRNPAWQRIAGRLPLGADLLAAFAVFVGKIANTRDFVIGCANERGLVVALDPDETFAALASRLAAAPPIDMPPASADPARHPRCDVGFGDAPGELLGDLHVRAHEAGAYELHYDGQLFTHELASRFARALAHVLRAADDTPVGRIGLLDEGEAAEQLAERSTPVFNWPQHLVLHELFEAKVDAAPTATALVLGDRRLTYAELDARANALAHRLVACGVGPDAIVALVFERSIEMIVAILGVLKAGGAYLPIEPDAPAERVRFVLADSAAAAVVTTHALADRVAHAQVIAVDDQRSSVRPPRRAEPHHLAYVIYTSGSTGQPKGVLIEHRNVVHLIFAEKDDFAIRHSDALILLSSYSFDASIDQIWLALASGAKLVLVERAWLLDPARLSRLINEESITHLDTIPALLAELSPMLASVRQVVVGGETCPVPIARTWCRTTRFWNEYGPTETTVGSLRQLVDPAVALDGRVPIGRPIGMTRVYILDWGGCPVPVGVRGELHLGGAGVARGYLHRDALTAERFVRDPFAHARARMYRTGDLVAWLPDGSVEFFGRVDSQVKLRGFRVELGEIEAAMLAHADVSGAAASVLPGERLACHFTGDRAIEAHELRELLARALPAYMIPDVFVQLDAFPRTVSGKIDRRALPAPVLANADAAIEPPANQVEAELRAIWSRVLGVAAAQISVTRSFFELGGHSLLVMQLLSRIRDGLGVTLAAPVVLGEPTIRAIAAAIAAADPTPAAPLPRARTNHAAPATSVQRRMYVIQQGNPRSTSYNLPLLYEVTGELAEAAIARACAALIERHESLRTTFFFQQGEILQKIAQAPRFTLERYDLERVTLEGATTAFVRPFPLEAPPLFRAAVFVAAGRVAYLALDMHHIIADGTSIDVLLEDLLALVHDRGLPAAGLRYVDYTAWVASDAGQQRLAAARAHWAQLLRDELPVLDLPYDFRRPLSRQQAAGEVSIALPGKVTAAIAACARDAAATPFAVLSAVYAVFLSCMTGNRDVVFGFPSAGRPHPDFERTVGMFVNSLPFRARIDRDDTFRDLLARARTQLRESLRAEDYPFEDMVGDLRLPPVPGRNPIFDTMLSYEGQMPETYRCGDAVLRERRLAQRVARMDLVVVIRDRATGGSDVRFEYSADLFKRATIERFARDFAAMIERVLAEPSVPLAQLHTIDAAERERLLHGFNATAHELPAVRAVHELFERHADARGDAPAVVMGATSWSYAEVERRANALAHVLRARGIGRDALVAIQLDPCPEMLVSVLGVMKAGAAFLPIDPDYPVARKMHMLHDSGARVMLTRGALADDLRAAFALDPSPSAAPSGAASRVEARALDPSAAPSGAASRSESRALDPSAAPSGAASRSESRALDPSAAPSGAASRSESRALDIIDLADAALWRGPSARVDAGVAREDLAYVIYTSGSTGTPKGTMIEHRGLLNFAAWYADFFRIAAGDGVSKYAGFGFDASISEIVPCFISGARLVVVPAELRLAVEGLDDYFAAHDVVIAFLPTQFGEQFLRVAKQHRLRSAFLGGEKLRNRPTERCEIVNGYGPTEYTVAATAFRVDKAYDNIPIGAPLWNTQIRDPRSPRPAVSDRRRGRAVHRGREHGARLPASPRADRGEVRRSSVRPRPPLVQDRRSRALARRWQHRVPRPHRHAGQGPRLSRRARRDRAGAARVAGDRRRGRGRARCRGRAHARRVRDRAARRSRGRAQGRARAHGAGVHDPVAHRRARRHSADRERQGRQAAPARGRDRHRRRDRAAHRARARAARDLRRRARPSRGVDQLRGELRRARRTFAQGRGAVVGDVSAHRRAAAVRAVSRCVVDRRSVARLARDLVRDRGRRRVGDRAGQPLPLTSSQRRIFAVHQLSTWSTAYNIPFAWELAADVELARLEHALCALVPRHTRCARRSRSSDGLAIQTFHAGARLAVEHLAIDDISLGVTLERFVRPFELAQAPLVRAAIVTTETRRVLALDLHHIIADGLSVRLLLEDLEALYADRSAAEPPAPTFADYAHWEASTAGLATRDAERAWWLERFAEVPSPLELPCDFDRPPRLAFDGDEVAVELSAEAGTPLLELAKTHGITPLGVFLAAWAVVVSRLGNTPDVVIGVPAAGRQRAGTERIVGMFVNTVPLRLRLRADEPFAELCVRIAHEAAEAFERQCYQLNDLVADLGLARDPSRNPLFDVLFAWEEAELAEMSGSRLGLVEIVAAPTSCKFDLELTVQNTSRGQRISLQFAKKLFRRATAERFLGNLRKVLEQVARNSDSLIRELRMLQPWERELLVSELNDTDVAVPRDATLVELFAAHVAARPEAIAVADADGAWTYAEVDRRSAILAATLIARGVAPEDVVGLALERSRRTLVAILGVLKAGAGYLPIEPDAPAERVALIMADSRARVLVTDAGVASAHALAWDAIAWEGDAAAVPSRARADGIAYVIYTSGSTGKPKGVVIEHRNVVNFIASSATELGVAPDDRVLLFSSFTFDASVAQIWLAIAAGAALVVPTKPVLLDHDAFEAFIAAHRITHLDCVPLFLSGFTPKHPLALRRIVVGGDICPVPVAARWAAAQPFYNEYGPTETTITSLRHEVTHDDVRRTRLPVGRPVANTRVYILDWTGNLAPLGVPGELYIGGAGVARGYLNNEQLTSERFVPNPYVPGERLYRTGDIARWLPEGAIDFLGRADNQVKIRGFRVELGEIEAALLRHPAVAEAAVIVVPHDDDKRLCGYVVLRRDVDVQMSALRVFLARTLPSYMVPDAIACLTALPVTTSGKIDRKRLPEPVFESAGEDDTPSTLAEEKLIEIWSDVLKLPRHQIPVARSFFELGGHSLLIMMLISRIQQTFTVRLTAADVFDHPTIRGLAGLIEEHERQAVVPIPRVAERDHYPLTSVQRRLFAIHQANPQGVHYNMPSVLAVEAADGKVMPERLEEVVRALIRRHASLRTSFHICDGELVSRVHPTAPFTLQIVDSDAPVDELMQRLMQPFDLAVAPLWRVWLVRRSDGREHVVVDMHHIIADGYATSILWREVTEIIRGTSLPPPPITVADYAVWERGPEHQAALATQRAFWASQFATLPAPLQLPYDFRHPAVRSHAGDLVVTHLSRDEHAALAALSRAQGSTLFATLLSCWFVFVSRIGGSDDVVVGVPVSGRAHPDVQDVVGMFVNTVPWRTRIPETGTFREFLASTKATSLDVLASEEYQLEDLLDDLRIRALPGRNPLFDVMFSFEARGADTVDAGRVQLRFEDFRHKTAKMDLLLVASETDAGVELAFEYATELFERATIERLARHFATLVRSVIDAPDQAIAALEILDDGDRAQLARFNDTAHDVPAVDAAHHLFEAWVRRDPDAPAVACRDVSWTYAEVDRRANAIAAWLVAKDIGRDDVVGILLDPCAEMLPAILGVMKAGAAFLPIDVEYPLGRKSYLLADSPARALLTRADLADAVAYDGPRLDVATSGELAHAPRVTTRSNDAAYVIYTSGSTGKPKGVVIEHRSLVNITCWFNDYYALRPREGVSKYAGFSFDAGITEIFPACLGGATLVIVPAELRLAPKELSAYLEAHAVGIAFLPTQFGEQFNRAAVSEGTLANSGVEGPRGLIENRTLRYMGLGGEKLRAYWPVPWKIVNAYGPTEYTVYTTAHTVDRQLDNIPIGKPVWNTQIHILDRRDRVCPIGIVGELCVAGAQIARGYLHRPELTAERFVPHPFARTPGERMYRTGDLARWLPDGTLEYLGRIDTQVKVRGYRIEIGEIEQALLAIDGVANAVVIDVADDAGATQLAAYVVGDATTAAICAALAHHLPDYMIPAYFSRQDALPMTPNGKVDKRALPAIDRGAGRTIEAPATDVERTLLALFASVLALDAAKVGVTASFFELGGHSLKAIALVGEVYRALGVELRVSDVFRHPTVRALARRLSQLEGQTALGAIEAASAADSIAASSVQERMYVVAQMEPASTVYNVANLLAVAPGVTREDVARALATLAARHDAFRCEFFLDGQRVRMRMSRGGRALSLPPIATTESARDADVEALVQPFDLSHAPLARAAWVTTERGAYLFFDMHHVVTDGVSMGILVDELEALLAGRALAPAERGLFDCTAWEHGERATELLAAQRTYWRGVFADGVPALGLLTDLPRPPVVAQEGETALRALPATTVRGLRELVQRRGLSMHAVMLAAFDVLLARLARQEDIAVGTPVSGRWHPDMQRVFGMFVNTIVLCNRVDPKQAFADFAAAVAARSLEALDNQAFPFAELVELVGDGRHAGHTPLVDVMFAMQNAEDAPATPVLLAPCAIANRTSKFDLSLVVDESRDGIQLAIEYRTSLFRPATIDRYLRCLDTLLADIVARPDVAVEALAILDAADRQLVHVAFNRTDVAYPDEVAAHRMFERAAARRPEARALVHGEVAWTYAEVDAAANRLAHALIALGIGRECIVAILTPPCCELIVAELAALKAGAAFLPLDHRYPRERLEYMLRDSGARVLIAAPTLADELDWAGPRWVLERGLFARGGATTAPPVEARATDLAYVIYTSGSTGKPKGVAIEHASLVPFIQRTIDFYGLTERDRHSKYAGIGFDVSIIETFPPLCCGGELHVVPDEIRLSPPELAAWLDRSGITMMDLPTQLAEEFMKQPRPTQLRWMTVGGDRLRRYYPTSFQLANEYGPTESTVSATTYLVGAQHDNIPIGKPNANTRVLVLDGGGQLCPPGVPGEICLAGKGLARGYLGAPELTAKKFVHSELAGGRMYHTGDLGRWLDDGNLEFLGRIDSQVKIRGYRIELGEVEQAILEVAGITACVVIDRDDPAGDKLLAAYVVSARGEHDPSAAIADIRAHLASRLPDYMWPAAFVALAEIPLTTSGKVDRRRLPEPELERRAHVAVPPANVAEAMIVDVFARALGRGDLGVVDDFFDFGGNSIKAVAVVAALASDFPITANDLFRLRTARACAAEIPMRRGDLSGRLIELVSEIRGDAGDDPLTQLAPELARYRARYRHYAGLSFHQHMAYRDVLLTGATGFLGCYLLRDLLLNTDAKVHVAIRASKRQDAWDRLCAKTARYFGRELLENHRRRVLLVPGDLAEPQLGLDRGTFSSLARTIDCVIHAAALTKHYGDHATFVRANVDATRHVIALARQAGCDFNLVSTISVGAGEIPGVTRALFTEFDCDLGQLAGNHYVRTKLDAEKSVLELRAEGLACNIFRVGFLTGDSRTLQFQDNAGDSGFVQTLRSYVELGKIPASWLAQSFCPVNEISDAIVRLLGSSSLLNQTHHLDREIAPADAERIYAADARCEPLDDAAFFEWLAAHLGDAGIGQAATGMLLHEGLLDRKIATETVTLREKTDLLLGRVGFQWSDVRPEQVWSLV